MSCDHTPIPALSLLFSISLLPFPVFFHGFLFPSPASASSSSSLDYSTAPSLLTQISKSAEPPTPSHARPVSRNQKEDLAVPIVGRIEM